MAYTWLTLQYQVHTSEGISTMAKRRLDFDPSRTLDDATEAAETGIATVTELRREIGVPVREIPLREIVDNPGNPRTTYDEVELEELAASIAEVGVLQPIVVRSLTPAERTLHPGARFLTVAGHRRRRAAAKAQLDTIPTVERAGGGGADDLVLMLTENMQRQDLKPLDEARSFKVLNDSGLTQMQISKALGISQAKISKRIALLELEPSVQATIAAGRIAAESAQAFRDADHDVQRRVAEMLQQNAREPREEGGEDDSTAAVAPATVNEVRDCVARAKRQVEIDARRRTQEEAARAAGARVLPENSKYADWRRQLNNPTPKQLEKLAAAGHLGAQVTTWSSSPTYYDTNPQLLTKKKEAEDRAHAARNAKRERQEQLHHQAEQAMASWAQQLTVAPTEAAALLAGALLEQNEHHLGLVYRWLHPEASADVDHDAIGRWVEGVKVGERVRLAILALAAEDVEYMSYNAEKRARTRDRVRVVAPELADQLDEFEVK